MTKFNLFPILFAIIMAMSFLTSCEKEELTNVASPEIAKTILPDASFKKQLEITDQAGNVALFEIGATDSKLLANFDNTSISFELGIADVATTSVEHKENNESENEKNITPDKNRKLVTIQLVSYHTINGNEVDNYRINFSETIKRQLRAENVATRIKLSPSTTSITNKTEGWWFYTPYCGKVITYGDGGVVKTGVTVYRAYLSGSTWYQSAIHTYYFYNNSYCTKCAHGVTYLDDIWVFQDVLSGVSVYFAC